MYVTTMFTLGNYFYRKEGLSHEESSSVKHVLRSQ